MGAQQLSLFAVAAPGLEGTVARELTSLGIHGKAEPGGVAWSGTRQDLELANLWSRSASRVLVRAAEYRARTFFELERHARKVSWSAFAPHQGRFRLRVSARKSKLYHEGAIAERLERFITEATGWLPVRDADVQDDAAAAAAASAQLFVVRVQRDVCTISADSSGALLHIRGYRQAVARAPVRETIAAAMLLALDWSPAEPLVDPLCGSGTMAIEAALLARDIAPGLASAARAPRPYAFEHWPDHDAHAWAARVAVARARIRATGRVAIHGSDRDAGAIRAALANAGRAGVVDDVAFAVQPLSAVRPPGRDGLLITNPPYGVRSGERRQLAPLYRALGALAHTAFAGWRLAVLAADERLTAELGCALHEVWRTRNGGIPVRLLRS